jgi:O-acetyl-ADP-ribose deacetylase (regulator of RNase III)
MQIHNTLLEVVRGSVLDQDVQAIVNAANTAMRGGGGIDGAIHNAAGPGLMDELRRVAPQGAKTGSVVVTEGHDLAQDYVFHTPGPVWHGGTHGEAIKLAACYRSCLEAANERRLSSLAFCSISTGVYGYPITLAAPLAVQTVLDYLAAQPETSLTRIIFAMYQQGEYEAFARALSALAAPPPGKE